MSLFFATIFACQAIAGSLAIDIPVSADEPEHGQCTAESGSSPGGNPDDCTEECCDSCVGGSAALLIAARPSFSYLTGTLVVLAAQFARAGPVEAPFRPPIHA